MGRAFKEWVTGLQIIACVMLTAIPYSILLSFVRAVSWGCVIAILTGPLIPFQALAMAMYGHFTRLSPKVVLGWGLSLVGPYLAHFWFYSGLWLEWLPLRTIFHMASWTVIAFLVHTPSSGAEGAEKPAIPVVELSAKQSHVGANQVNPEKDSPEGASDQNKSPEDRSTLQEDSVSSSTSRCSDSSAPTEAVQVQVEAGQVVPTQAGPSGPAKSGVLPNFLFGIYWSGCFYMFNDFWPNYGLGVVAILGYAISTLLLVLWKIWSRDITNDKDLLLIHAYNLNAFTMSLMLLYGFNFSLGPLVTNAFILVWSVSFYQIEMRLAVKVTAACDVYLWMFPISFASHLVQMVLFTDGLATQMRFALMIVLQEVNSILSNTGCKDWMIHKCKVKLGRQGADMNPFHNKEIFYDIASRASINILSEFAALGAVAMAVVGEYVTRSQFGATGMFCSTICGRDPRDVLVRLSIVWAVKLVVVFVEHQLTHHLLKRELDNAFLSRLSIRHIPNGDQQDDPQRARKKKKRKYSAGTHAAFLVLLALSVTTTALVLVVFGERVKGHAA